MEPAPELRIITMLVEVGVGQPRLNELEIGERPAQPPVVGLATTKGWQTRRPHGDPVNGELVHERVHKPFWRFA